LPSSRIAEFSTLWKNFFHTVEKVPPIFPHRGKTRPDFSTQWKNFARFFHTMEKV